MCVEKGTTSGVNKCVLIKSSIVKCCLCVEINIDLGLLSFTVTVHVLCIIHDYNIYVNVK